MKKIKFFGLLVFVLAMAFFAFACAKSYKVTIVKNDGNEDSTVEIKKMEELELPTLSKEGYEFGGWYIDEGCSQKFDSSMKLESDLSVYAKWDILKYTVKFYVDGTLVDTQNVEYNGNATAPDAPTLEAYNFLGWDKEFRGVKANLEVNAILQIKTFTVKFMKGNGELKSEEVEYGSSATAPADPQKNGFDFKGWDKEFTNVTSNLTVNAIFEAKTINVKYYDGEEELSLSPASFKYGDEFNAPSYSDEGYLFVGWYKDSAFEYAFDPEESLSEDFNLYALLIKIDYNGGTNSWRVGAWDETNTVTKGLNNISSLPAEYEKDFYKYLSDEGLLNSSSLGEGLSVSSFEEFSSVNKLHDGDPQRVWNDTVLTKADATSCGYSSLFLYDSIELDSEGNIKDVNGGFLGTEPYKTKYFTLLQQAYILFKSKYSVDVTGGGPSACQLFAYIIDGYFYGTQSVTSTSKAEFIAFRTAVPTPTTYYTWDGSKIVEHEREYVLTTDLLTLSSSLAVPFYEGKSFAGWYIDSACTQSLDETTVTNRMTVYAKWE